MIRPLNECDRAIVFDYLNRYEEETAFLIGNILQFGMANRRDMMRCGDYFGYFEGIALKGIIAFFNMGTCVPHFESEGAVANFADLMIRRSFSVILGMDRIVRPIFDMIRHYKSLKEFEECSYLVNNNFKSFKLEGTEYLDVSRDSDFKLISFVRKAYLRGFGIEYTLEGAKLLLSQRNEEENFLILSKEGKYLAQACIQAFTYSTEQIGAVYTLEEERGKGYGKAVVSELCERIINRGKLPTLIVNKSNFPAVNAYKALGFEWKDNYLIIRLFI